MPADISVLYIQNNSTPTIIRTNKDANTEIKSLKEKIQLTTSGDFSDVVQQQLCEIEQLKVQIQISASEHASLQEELEKSKRQLPDVEKFKKQIKKLEEEIEDYEDDLDDYQKKIPWSRSSKAFVPDC